MNAKVNKLIKEYELKICSIDNWHKNKKESLSEIRWKLSRPHTTCYSHDDYEQTRDEYNRDRGLNFTRRQAYVQIIEDLKELV